MTAVVLRLKSNESGGLRPLAACPAFPMAGRSRRAVPDTAPPLTLSLESATRTASWLRFLRDKDCPVVATDAEFPFPSTLPEISDFWRRRLLSTRQPS